ncbi:MAG: tRNA (N(6)-L-threonylcarbamoyladenosine(37)-C(2))-methylthiotransferase MtaB [Chloroflexi bacterium]|nr:tRNA (N(6)-L-threonylcarbamoyladenosine(37)-C(2))-methylthiotransferase MtaB [Chloroflexota bacterium]
MSESRRPTVYIQTHGCKLNQADTQALASQFLEAGYTLASKPEGADVSVVNTCTVTHVADSKARQALRAARRASPGALVVATGCYAQRAPDQLARLQAVDLVVGNAGKEELVAQVGRALGVEAPAAAVIETGTEKAAGLRTRTMVKIQEGCNQVCAYCIVPKVRGRERSIPPDLLVEQVQRRVSEGYREVVLTGSQLGTYGFELNKASLGQLITCILLETEVVRLRVSSLQAHEVTPDLLELWTDPRLCPHFHLPLQSGSAAVLARMRRRYTPPQYEAAVALVRNKAPAAAVTTDVIVGFPGETEEQFEETYQICRRLAFAGLHVFPYSPRPGTSAAHFPQQVPDEEKGEQMSRLLALGKELAARFRDGVLGTIRPVLWESSRHAGETPMWSGLTDNYVRVAAFSHRRLHNQLTPFRLERRVGEMVWGKVIQEA